MLHVSFAHCNPECRIVFLERKPWPDIKFPKAGPETCRHKTIHHMPKQPFVITCIMFCLLLSDCRKADFGIRILESGVYNIHQGHDLIDEPGKPVYFDIPVEILNTRSGQVELLVTVEDIWGLPVILDDNRFLIQTGEMTGSGLAGIRLNLPNGFYRIQVIAVNGDQRDIGFTEIGIVPPSARGLRPNSFFASNTSDIKLGKDLGLLDLLGIKVQRTHFYPETDSIPAIAENRALEFNYSLLDRYFDEAAGKGTWVLPIAGYAFPGTRSALAEEMNLHGPPRHFGEFALSWKDIIRRYPEIRVYELWNEPWIFEWTWAANAADYREMQKLWCEAALDADSSIRIIAGNSCMFVEDNIEPYPEIWKGLIHGTTHHPYAHAEARSLRHNAQIRSIDYGYLVNRRMNLPYYYLTEGGTLYSTPAGITGAWNKIEMLLKKMVRLDNGEELIALFNNYRYNHNAIKYSDPRRDDISRTKIHKQELKDLLLDKGAGNKESSEILESLLDAFYISLQDEIGKGHNSNVNASKAVHYTVFSALHGAYQTNIQWRLGFGPEWTRSNTTLAVCSYFLEDRTIVADIWPESNLTYGAVFANPEYIDNELLNLERSGELTSRWEEPVPENAKHKDLKVAVVFSLTGPTQDSLDTHGTITIPEARHIRAFDCTGREIFKHGSKMIIPLNEYPVYLVTTELTAFELHQAVSDAEIENVSALSFYATSLTRPVDESQVLHLRIDNHVNRIINGEVTISISGQKVGRHRFSSQPGLTDFYIPVDKPEAAQEGIYPARIEIVSDAGNYSRTQLIQRALFTRGSRVIDGKLDDWKDSRPVIIDSDMLKQGIDLTRYLFNPTLEKPDSGQAEDVRVAAMVYTSFDESYVYVAAEVLEDTLINTAGREAMVSGVGTGYTEGMPGGLMHPRFTGDMLMLGFGFRDRVPGFGRQMDDPLAWKGQFYDTDYLYLAYTSESGSQLIRQWGADTHRQNGFQTDPAEAIDQVPGAEIVIKRDEENKTTVYEIAIPRDELDLFCEKEEILRFGFILVNNEGAGIGGKLQWSEAAGVFDYWLNLGSYAPTWDQNLPCQTFFGITD